jgi:bile acid:Na+ symporter, BASS family
MPVSLDITIPLYTFVIMFTVGTGLTLTDFRQVAGTPRTVVVASLTHMVCLPLAGLIVVLLLPLNEFVVAGVLLIAACPGGSIANFYVYLARANVALAVILTGISCLAAMMTMPLVMMGFASIMNVPEAFQVPVKPLLQTLGLFLVLPILLGMVLRYARPAFVVRHDRWLRGGSLTLLVALIIQVLWQAPEALTLDLAQTLQAGAAMAVLAVLAGMLLGRLLKLVPGDFWAVVIRMMVQNIALATTIAVSVYHQPRFASFAVAYFLMQVPIAVVLILFCLRKNTIGTTTLPQPSKIIPQ